MEIEPDYLTDNVELEYEPKGTKLICVNDLGYDQRLITYGKQYVLDENFTSNEFTCIVINNENNRATLNRHRFITLEQWREQQIDKICQKTYGF